MTDRDPSPPRAPRGQGSHENRAVVLVEGTSDGVALETLAKRRGRDLAAEGISIVVMGGAQAIGRFLESHSGSRIRGLYDAGEERAISRALERAGFGARLDRARLEALGFYVCDRDLEDELIRALGAERVLHVAEVEGDLSRFRTLQKQPEWRAQPIEEQLRRFMGSGGSRKIRYAGLLVEALDLSRVPRPLDLVLP